jgi:hypothetical protein
MKNINFDTTLGKVLTGQTAIFKFFFTKEILGPRNRGCTECASFWMKK